MKNINLLLTLVIVTALNASAQDDVTVSETTTTEVTVSETTTTEQNASTEEAAKDDDIRVDCSNAYSEMVKSLPKAKQQAEFENWWAYNDNQLAYYKGDEFKMKEERPKWQKLFNEMLSASSSDYIVWPKVKIGQYDFKKKGFPVDINIEGKEKYLQNYYANTFSMGGLGVGTTDKALCPLSQQDPKKDNPSEVVFVLKNLQQLKFIAVPEEKAKLLTASLGSGRLIDLKMKVTPVKTVKVTRKVGTFRFTKMVMDVNVKQTSLQFDGETLLFDHK